MSTPYKELHKKWKEAEVFARSTAVEKISEIIIFLNSEDGIEWLADQVEYSDNDNLKKQLRMFQYGHTTGLVLSPCDISRYISGVEEDNLRIILRGKSGQVSAVEFGEWTAVYHLSKPGLVYETLSNDANQQQTINAVMFKAKQEHPSVRANPNNFGCVIFRTPNERAVSYSYDCLVYRRLGATELVHRIGVAGATQFVDGFKKARRIKLLKR